MDLKILAEDNLRELTPEEKRSINGGKPDKTTSFWYDVTYFLSHKVGEMVKDGILTKGWWEDWSIDLSS